MHRIRADLLTCMHVLAMCERIDPLYCIASRSESAWWSSHDVRFVNAPAAGLQSSTAPESYFCRVVHGDVRERRGFYGRRDLHPAACSGASEPLSEPPT